MKLHAEIISKLAGAGAAIITAGLFQSAQGSVITVDNLLNPAAGPNSFTDTSGAIFQRAPAKSGTGSWNPFLTLGSDKGALIGYNTDAKADPVNNPDIVTGGNRTHSVKFGDLGYYTDAGSGINYVRFLLDINEPSNNVDRFLALNDFRIYAPVGSGFDKYTGPVSGLGTALYDMDSGGDRTLLLDYSLSPGSGESDLELLVPLSLFGSLPLDRSIVVYSTMGDGTGITGSGFFPGGALYSSVPWGADAGGFEEWNLSKTDKPVVVPEASTYVMASALVGGLGIVEIRRRRSQKSPAVA